MDVKELVRNLMRNKPKGFIDIKDLDKYLRTNKIEVQDPFAYMVRLFINTKNIIESQKKIH